MNEFVENYIINNKVKSVLQVGGNDGSQDDFLKNYIIEYGLHAHILEPVEEYYKELKQNYINNHNVKTYNYAITSIDGEQEINFIKCSQESPIWLKGCSSFHLDRNVLSGYGNLNLKDKMPDDLMNYIRENTFKIKVKTLCFNSFININNIDKIEFIVLDTEGCELEILKQINFEELGAKIIILEYHNQTDADKKEILEILKNNQFKINNSDWDLCAFK